MSKSQLVRVSDVRQIGQLVGECQELWDDSQAWRTHLYEQLCELIGAQTAMGGEMGGLFIGRQIPFQTLSWGLPPAELTVFQTYMARADDTLDVPNLRFGEALRDSKKPGMTADQRDFVPLREWRRSVLYNEYLRGIRHEHRLISFYQLPHADDVACGSIHRGMVLWRVRGEKPFSVRQQRIVDYLQQQLSPLVGSALSSVAGDVLAELPPRVGQTLLRLLAGDSEKQAAAHMGVSRHTVHAYVMRLHRHFQVSSRRELLARCRALLPRAVSTEDDAEESARQVAEALPSRVQEALALMLRGMSNEGIARQMGISPHTARDNAKRIYRELGVSTRAELLARCGNLFPLL